MPSFWNSLMPWNPRIGRHRVGGIETRIVEVGPVSDGPAEDPVLMVHGASGHLESFLLTLPYLADRRRAIAFDLPCHGYASCSPHPFDVVEHAEYVAELARDLGVRRAAIVGQSLGGAIAARIAIDGLFDVDRLVLIGSAGVPGQSRRNPAHSMKAALRARGFEDVKGRLEFAMTCRGPEFDELVECRYLAYQWGDWETRSNAFTYHETDRGRERATASAEEWSTIDKPTLLIWGTEDQVVQPSSGEYLSKLIPGAELRVVEGCGHNPQFERPDEVNPIIASFLGSP